MFSLKSLLLGGALVAAPFLMAGEASADHYKYGRYGSGHYHHRYAPSYAPGYRHGFGHAPRGVYARPPINPYHSMYGSPYRGGPGFSRYGSGYPVYGTRGTSLGISPRGFSLYIGR